MATELVHLGATGVDDVLSNPDNFLSVTPPRLPLSTATKRSPLAVSLRAQRDSAAAIVAIGQ